MSDSDDDWFNKDEEDIVKSIKKKPEDVPGVEYIKYASNIEPVYHFPSSNFSPLPYSKLKRMANMDSIDIFLEVGSSEFLRSFSANIKIDSIILIVNIFGKLSRLDLPDLILEYVHVFIEDKCLNRNIVNLAKKLIAPSNTALWQKSQLDVLNIVDDLLSVIERAFELNLQNNKLKNLLEQLLNVLCSVNEDSKFFQFKNRIIAFLQFFDQPPSVKEIGEILPSLDDFKYDRNVLLKPNIVNGQYASVKQYLKIQMDLLREDFISPLRNAVLGLRGLREESSEVKFYKNVKIVSNEVLTVPKSQMLFVDVFASLRGDIEISKRREELKILICGSLLCFSTSEQFDKNLILAVISNTDSDILSQGYINIEVLSQYNVGRICGIDLQMLVCPVFFEPYRYAFNVLGKYNGDGLPMAQYIVYADNKQKVPPYLAENNEPKYTFLEDSFNPFILESYPSSVKENLTETQLKAFQYALSSEFSLIQGPPGTGKTKITSKIAATLLSNTSMPIIVISYTNDALDKFILTMLPHTDSIVRLGNQSKNETLEKFNIKEIFNTMKGDHRCRQLYYNMKVEYNKKFIALQNLQIDFDGTEEDYQKIVAAQAELRSVSNKLECLKMISTYLAVKDKRIIAMTTTCAARHHLMIKLLKESIVIFEEAAEVLESHILSSLTKYTQQVVLVGDHFQLRPHTSVYKLSETYKMNISLFERMVKNNINVVCLDTQFRMRTEIANLIRPIIYHDLKDGPTVGSYPDIKGIIKNLYFVTHTEKENNMDTLEISKFNDFERTWMCNVAAYLLKQNYKHTDIVMLTPYLKQKDRIKNYVNQKFTELQGIRISTVDNFQGQEANIVLLSLVRSNDQKQIGYLKEKNRICVALSRAKMGLYIVGNMKLLADCSETWQEISNKLYASESIGPELPLLFSN